MTLQAFIEIKHGLPVNTDMMCAAEGFEQLGYQIRTFERTDILTGKYRLFYGTSPFVGSIDSMKSLFRQEGVQPQSLDFPAEIDLGRTVTKMTLRSAVDFFRYNSGVHGAVFIKPVETKLFDGMLLDNFSAIRYFEPFFEANPECWVSDKLDIISEFRGFVYNGELVDFRQYSGNIYLRPNIGLTKAVMVEFEEKGNAPVAYTIDVAKLRDELTVVIEFNDFWAIGSYGLEPKVYARMLRDRYMEIMK